MLANNLAKLSLLIALIGLGVQLYPPDIMQPTTLPIEAETEAVEFDPDGAAMTAETPAVFTPLEAPVAVEFTQPDVTFSPVGGPNVTPIAVHSVIFLLTVLIVVLFYSIMSHSH